MFQIGEFNVTGKPVSTNVFFWYWKGLWNYPISMSENNYVCQCSSPPDVVNWNLKTERNKKLRHLEIFGQCRIVWRKCTR